MKIGVISDTHGSLTAWQNAVDYFKRADLIIHCGDLLYHGPRNPLPDGYDPAKLATAVNQTRQRIVFAKGNCDSEVDQLMVNVPIMAPYAQVFTPDWQILAHHGHTLDIGDMPDWTHGYNLIISGHTHLPGITRQGRQVFLNPGSPALPKNEDLTPTIALIDGQRISIIDLEKRKKWKP